MGLQQMRSVDDPHNNYLYRTMFNVTAMPWDWPCEVNAFEAQAYCNWKSCRDQIKYRLPREAEYHVWNGVRDGHRVSDPTPEDPNSRNVGMLYGSPTPVDWFEPNESGVCDGTGNVWQLMENEFKPLPGFKPHSLYPDFSEPHFTPENIMALGGSWASCGQQTSQHYRLWWLEHFYQHMGFRLAVSTDHDLHEHTSKL